MPYDFHRQLQLGEEAERLLDRLISKLYYLEPASPVLQRRGVDRIATPLAGGRTLYFEYKADWAAGRTGNAFIEMTSVDTIGKAGWATASKSGLDFLLSAQHWAGLHRGPARGAVLLAAVEG